MSLVSSKLNAIYNRLLNDEHVVKHLKIKKIVALPKKAAVPKKHKQTTEEKKKIAVIKKILKAEENERKIIKRLLAVRD